MTHLEATIRARTAPAEQSHDRAVTLSIPADELWIITRHIQPLPPVGDDNPGSGALLAKLPSTSKEIPLPLKHTEVKADISGYIAAVDVTQQYHNPYEEKIEAVYVFPLPHNGAVNEFIMTIGERRIRGIIREREEAEKIYKEARQQGYVASLLTQERPNIFTQSVANIEPGKQIDINIRYFHTLAFDDGAYEFVFPMVVGPRFNPPDSTDGIGAVASDNRGGSGQKTEVAYLKPGQRSSHDIGLTVSIDAGVSIERVECRSHVVEVRRPSPERAEVRLAAADSVPNRDFVLRYHVAGEKVKSAFLAGSDQRGKYFTLMVHPPSTLSALPRRSMEMIFVLDCSGSMNGEPIAQAKQAIARALHHLGPQDSFQIIRFSNNASQLGSSPLDATEKNIRKGEDYLKSLEGEGGTMMIEGIKAALDFPHDPDRLRFVSFMTDGYIGNETEILGEIHKRLGASRIFSFGVGSSTNRYLLDHMARMGRGAVAYLGLHDSAAEVMDRFFERISHPAMTDLKVDFCGLRVSDVYPTRAPDLFVGRPVILTGRFSGSSSATVRITGKVGTGEQVIELPVNTNDAAATHAAIAPVWARMKIADLADRSSWESGGDFVRQIKRTALDYNLMSSVTAFVAVDSLTRTAGDHGTSVRVPVPVPEGVRYETTVDER